jgi:hypothetical protein
MMTRDQIEAGLAGFAESLGPDGIDRQDGADMALWTVGEAILAGASLPETVLEHLYAVPAEWVDHACETAARCAMDQDGFARATFRGALAWATGSAERPDAGVLDLLPDGAIRLMVALLEEPVALS